MLKLGACCIPSPAGSQPLLHHEECEKCTPGAFLGWKKLQGLQNSEVLAGSRKGVQAGKVPMGRTRMAYALVQVSQREGSRVPVREER